MCHIAFRISRSLGCSRKAWYCMVQCGGHSFMSSFRYFLVPFRPDELPCELPLSSPESAARRFLGGVGVSEFSSGCHSMARGRARGLPGVGCGGLRGGGGMRAAGALGGGGKARALDEAGAVRANGCWSSTGDAGCKADGGTWTGSGTGTGPETGMWMGM